jgi:transcriptional regulator with PAS, ATPase and Fis domain
MAVHRRNIVELGRLLNSVGEPIYVLDDDLTIVFLNRACQEWLGESSEGLLGSRCVYHSSDAVQGPSAVAAGLCPPPQVLAGQPLAATISYTSNEGSLNQRRAQFLPLACGSDGVFAVIAVLEAAATSPPLREPIPRRSTLGDAAPADLHEQILHFRREAAARYRADRLIGNGPAMRLVRRQLELAVGSQSNVLLVGPPGSGRQHLATAIHYGTNWPASSSLIAAGLIPVDCSLLAADLLDFLIAAIAKINAMGASAGSGAMLFSRMDELSADVQAELALMLGHGPLPLRLIATAAEPLLELARRGRFRDDLAAMLSTIVIELPSLAQRRDDLPLLAQLFLEDVNASATGQIGGFTAAALDALDAYPWPGNLDELAAVVAEAHQRAHGAEIDVNDLPEKLHWAAQAAAHPQWSEETIVLDEYLARVERELIRRALARCKGNKAKAARLLGMTRPRLYRRMVQLGLE